MNKRRTHIRKQNTRKYKRMYVISAEGEVSEKEYFKIFNNDTTVLHVKILKHAGSSPDKVLKKMREYLTENPLKKDDHAWLVVDKDSWTEDQLKRLFNWSTQLKKYGFAVSNPKFEYWLLLHFEDSKGNQSSQMCSDRLEKHIPGYKKHIAEHKIKPYIQDAIHRAEQQDSPPCLDWPRHTGTTVYRLVKELIE